MATNAQHGIYSCQKVLGKQKDKLLPPLVRAPEERILFLWVSPRTVLSKQICNSAHKSGALSFIFGWVVELD